MLGTLVGGMLSFSVGYALAAPASERTLKPVAAASPAPAIDSTPAADTPAPPAPEPTPTPAPPPVHPSFDSLAAALDAITAPSGAQVGISLIELGGPAPSTWEVGGSLPMNAASTYKLPALMEEAQLVAAGKLDPAGQVCYQDGDWEDGWFDDYTTGACYSRAELANRAGLYSDNTAGHMLVRDLGGGAALNAYAATLGAQDSSFFDLNQTTADDLARLLEAEAVGTAGGAQAQAWLYPRLSNSKYEAGIPAGVPPGTTVIHKTGELDAQVNDAAIVSGGKSGPYVLAVMTDGLGGDAGMALIAQVSAAVWAYEATR
ncbi:MAG TPA: serine hydrolase [Candidatus Dormibacteraeota bacterium]